jgi:hypothetical protein
MSRAQRIAIARRTIRDLRQGEANRLWQNLLRLRARHA